jgi:hypothetical protein
MSKTKSIKRLRFRALALSLLILLLANFPAFAALQTTTISGLSPYPVVGDPDDPQDATACNGAPQFGVLYRNSESEPHLAVNPADPDNMIASWHQDRWSTGAAQGLGAAYTNDGGLTWTQVNVPFSRCSGAEPGSTGDYERASDPWISFSPDGTAHFMALVADIGEPNRNGMLVASSTDGGATWAGPVKIKASPAKDPVAVSVFHDKNTLTADPFDPDLVYATWTLFRLGSTTLLFSRSTDGGEKWFTHPIDNIEVVGPAELVVFRQGAQIVVLPDGTLLNAFFRILFNQKTFEVSQEQAIFRSFDQGKHWEKMDTVVGDLFPAVAVDTELGIPVRDAQQLPDVAVDRSSGDLYYVWQDTRFSDDGLVGVVISKSEDGGSTWSDPVAVNTVPEVQAFLPVVAVNEDGTVGVLFYDFRDDVLGDAELSTDVFLKRYDPDLSLVDETRLTLNSFDLRQSVITGPRGYFPGDYVGLDTSGPDFVAAFTVTNPLGLPVDFPQAPGLFVDTHNRQDILFARIGD